MFDSFDNMAQGLFTVGGIGYKIAPVLQSLASVLMAISVYKESKAKGHKYRWVWIIATLVSPFVVRIIYYLYHRFIDKTSARMPCDEKTAKQGNVCIVFSVLSYVLSFVLLVTSVVSMGAGGIRSIIKGEPLTPAYDMNGNLYSSYTNVPLRDCEGNTYLQKITWKTLFFTVYTDQNGKEYDGKYAYIDRNGYFFYDENETLTPYEENNDYYTDGEMLYYPLMSMVYWDKDGDMFSASGKYHVEIFTGD